jgi:putative ABC transport system permease protein
MKTLLQDFRYAIRMIRLLWRVSNQASHCSKPRQKWKISLANLHKGIQKPMANFGVSLISLHEEVISGIKKPLLILFGTVGFVLLIACFNATNLLLARATTRAREFAVRLALGATRSRIIQQVLVESLLLAVLGGMLGLLLFAWVVNLFLKFGTDELAHIKNISVDHNVLGFTL